MAMQDFAEAEGELRRLLAAQWRMSGPLNVAVSELMPLLEHLSQGNGGTAAKVRRAMAEGQEAICLRAISLQCGPDFSC